MTLASGPSRRSRWISAHVAAKPRRRCRCTTRARSQRAAAVGTYEVQGSELLVDFAGAGIGAVRAVPLVDGSPLQFEIPQINRLSRFDHEPPAEKLNVDVVSIARNGNGKVVIASGIETAALESAIRAEVTIGVNIQGQLPGVGLV